MQVRLVIEPPVAALVARVATQADLNRIADFLGVNHYPRDGALCRRHTAGTWEHKRTAVPLILYNRPKMRRSDAQRHSYLRAINLPA